MKMRITLAFFAALACGGCVGKGKYESLQKKYEATNAELTESKQKEKSLEKALAEEQAKVKELNTDISSLNAKIKQNGEELARLQADKQVVEGELASVVKDRARLQSSAEELKQALTDLNKRKAEAEKRVSQYRDLLARFKSLIDAGKLKVKITDGRMVLALPTDVLFESGKADLSAEGKIAIAEVAQILGSIPDRKFQIEGHTDNVPISTSRYPSNWELAAARALVVLKTMRDAGMRGEGLSAASFGEFRPVSSNDTEEGRRANRRIEIVIVPDLSSLPGFDELNRAVDTGGGG